jgi:hypothetical protein
MALLQGKGYKNCFISNEIPRLDPISTNPSNGKSHGLGIFIIVRIGLVIINRYLLLLVKLKHIYLKKGAGEY